MSFDSLFLNKIKGFFEGDSRFCTPRDLSLHEDNVKYGHFGMIDYRYLLNNNFSSRHLHPSIILTSTIREGNKL